MRGSTPTTRKDTMGNLTSSPSALAKEGASGRGAFLPPYPVLACMAVIFWSLFSRALIYTVMPTIAERLQLSNSTVGGVIAIMLLGYCLGFWFGGRLPGGRKARIMAGTLLSVPAVLLISRADGLWLLLIAVHLMGLGIGVYHPVGLSIIVDYGGETRRARYMAMHEFSGTTGSFSASTALALMLTWMDWRAAVMASSVIGLLAVLTLIFMKDEGAGLTAKVVRRESIPVDIRLLYATIAQASVSIMLMGLISVLPLIMVRAWGLTQVEAASAIGYTRLAGLLGVAIAGLNADRWGHTRALLAFQITSLIGLLVMSVNEYGTLFLGGMLVLAAGAVGTICLLPLIVAGAYPFAQREQALATVGGMGSFLGMVGAPAAFGILIDAGLETGAIAMAAAVATAAIFAQRSLSLQQR